MGKYHIFQENTEFTPKILKMGEIYTDSEMCWLEALSTGAKKIKVVSKPQLLGHDQVGGMWS